MTDFQSYLLLGFQHILDWNAYDHLLFIVALTAIYPPSEWKKILILVTAFTIGHSLTLILAMLNVIHFPSDVIEFLIPCTILFTALSNIRNTSLPAHMKRNYGLALGFGLIHGLGFSNGLRALLGKESSLLQPLFAFNLGLEMGQIVIVVGILLLMGLAVHIIGVKMEKWTLFVSGIAAGIALILMKDACFWCE